MIILEGPDNSGKTSFANLIGLIVHTAGPAPKNEDEEQYCLDTQQARAASPVVHDRVTCISSQVYSNRMFNTKLAGAMIEMINTPTVIVVYCRPPERCLMDFSTHAVKSYDTEEHLKKIMDNQHQYIANYDALMSKVPCVIYDWTDQSVVRDRLIADLISAQDPSQWQSFMDRYTRKPL